MSNPTSFPSGPWKFKNDGAFYVITSPDMSGFAVVPKFKRFEEQQAKVAMLISAAPEMLEVLKSKCTFCQFPCRLKPCTSKCPVKRVLEKALGEYNAD